MSLEDNLKLSPTEMIIVRHSERIDEVDELLWREIYLKEMQKNKRDKKSIVSDPVITVRGISYANDAARTVQELIISSTYHSDSVVLYSSRLIRCVQTAYQIALLLNKPIKVSGGLALTAAAVEKAGDKFMFLTTEDIQALCPGVEIIDCDKESDSLNFVSSSNWLDPILEITNQSIVTKTIPIIVAHRETIRNIAKRYIKLPYCAIGLYEKKSQIESIQNTINPKENQDFDSVDSNDFDSGLHMTRIFDKDGRLILSNEIRQEL
eukprot:gene8412-11378_t